MLGPKSLLFSVLLPVSVLSYILPRNEAPPVDPGEEYGSVYIKNSCGSDLYAYSVGAWLEGSDHSNDEFTIPAGGTYHEAYRVVVPKEGVGMDSTLKKMPGQGISIKISNVTGDLSNILQLEYSLVQNPLRDKFRRLDYDISLLDCAKPPADHANMTDVQSSQELEWNQKKIDGCPGYQGGVALWFTDSKKCRPIYCDGQSYCDGIYNYDKTREGEMSLACHEEYRGDLYFEVCVGNGNGSVHLHGRDCIRKHNTDIEQDCIFSLRGMGIYRY
ncbi:hypothetical protein BU26DRAFT_434100 [Trematosphaeria pertusa]|uniref:Uncharacterized protein n=1 Tax=Trematosphaeria pertusa TaxID=390896 RepID=A0A6A6I385_9PLEO|nr:uncharacterized protein BU26DRAFT_434100 [Trematosphaeria pertusa]KAF2244717.1 hypothetical protein BU26DRAFT_434100 [Trematosphaeria pertusa]